MRRSPSRQHLGRLDILPDVPAYGPARERTAQAWRRRERPSIQDRLRLEAWREQLADHVGNAGDNRFDGYVDMFVPVGLAWIYRESGRHQKVLELVVEAGALRTDPVGQFYLGRYRCLLLLAMGQPGEVLRWVDATARPLDAGHGPAADNQQLAGIARRAVTEFRAFALAALDELEHDASDLGRRDRSVSTGLAAPYHSTRATLRVATRPSASSRTR